MEIEPGEAAVIYNTVLARGQTVRLQQGTFPFVPFFQHVEKVDVQPHVLRMKGEVDSEEDPDLIRKLTVRASDGSKLWFDDLEIHYELIPSAADAAIRCHGRGAANRVKALTVHAREVLRNEFGRFTFLEIADPSNYAVATTRAEEELNRRLKPCGLRVTQIIPTKPRFDDEVEKAIEDRQTAEQQVKVEMEKRNRLEAQKQRRIQDVPEAKNAEHKGLIAQIEGSLQEARNRLVRVKREADVYYTEQVAACEAERDAAIVRAKANREAQRKEAEGLAARIRAVGQQGDGALNLAIAEHVFPQLQQVQARPYAALPARMDLLYAPPADVAPSQ